MNSEEHSHPVDIAANHLGGRLALSKKLGLTVSAVGNWCLGLRRIPVDTCVRIEQLTNGNVTRIQLRPNDWWKFSPELATIAPEQPKIPTDTGQFATKTIAQKEE